MLRPYDVISGLMTSHPCEQCGTRLRSPNKWHLRQQHLLHSW